MDYDEIINPKKTVKRRMEEAGEGDAGGGAAKKAAAEAEPGGVRFTTGQRTLTPEEQAKRIEQFRALQRKQRKAVVI